MMSFRELLQRELDLRGWKNKGTAAEKLGVDPEYFRQILRGARSCPSDDVIIRIASGLWPIESADRERKIFEMLAAGAQERAGSSEAKSAWDGILKRVEEWDSIGKSSLDFLDKHTVSAKLDPTHSEDVAKKDPPPVDVKLLAYCIKTVTKAIKDLGGKATLKERAEWIAEGYQILKERGDATAFRRKMAKKIVEAA